MSHSAFGVGREVLGVVRLAKCAGNLGRVLRKHPKRWTDMTVDIARQMPDAPPHRSPEEWEKLLDQIEPGLLPIWSSAAAASQRRADPHDDN